MPERRAVPSRPRRQTSAVLRLRAALSSGGGEVARAVAARRDPAARHRARRRGRARPRRAGRALEADAAGARRSGARRVSTATAARVTRFGRAADLDDGHYAFSTVKPGADARRLGALPARHRLRARPAAPPVHPRLLRRRGRRNAGDPLLRARRPGPPRHARRARRRRTQLPFRHPPAGRRRDRLPRLRERGLMNGRRRLGTGACSSRSAARMRWSATTRCSPRWSTSSARCCVAWSREAGAPDGSREVAARSSRRRHRSRGAARRDARASGVAAISLVEQLRSAPSSCSLEQRRLAAPRGDQPGHPRHRARARRAPRPRAGAPAPRRRRGAPGRARRGRGRHRRASDARSASTRRRPPSGRASPAGSTASRSAIGALGATRLPGAARRRRSASATASTGWPPNRAPRHACAPRSPPSSASTTPGARGTPSARRCCSRDRGGGRVDRARPDRSRPRPARLDRGRRADPGQRRRLVVDAAQAQPGRCGRCSPPRPAGPRPALDGAAARARRRTSGPQASGTRRGSRCASSSGSRSRRRGRGTHGLGDLDVDREATAFDLRHRRTPTTPCSRAAAAEVVEPPSTASARPRGRRPADERPPPARLVHPGGRHRVRPPTCSCCCRRSARRPSSGTASSRGCARPRAGVRILRIDLPGHGASPAATEAVHRGGPGRRGAPPRRRGRRWPFHVAGRLARRRRRARARRDEPDRVTDLAMFCSGARIGEADGWAERAAQVRALGHGLARRGERGPLVRARLPRRESRRPRSARCCRTLVDVDDESLRALREALAGFDRTASRRRGRRARRCCVTGEFDEVTTPASMRELADEFPGGALRRTRRRLAPRGRRGPDASGRRCSRRTSEPAPTAPWRAAGCAVRRAVLGDAHVDARDRGARPPRPPPSRTSSPATPGARSGPGPGSRAATADRDAREPRHRRARGTSCGCTCARPCATASTRDEIAEVILHTALYAGLPVARTARSRSRARSSPKSTPRSAPKEKPDG